MASPDTFSICITCLAYTTCNVLGKVIGGFHKLNEMVMPIATAAVLDIFLGKIILLLAPDRQLQACQMLLVTFP